MRLSDVGAAVALATLATACGDSDDASAQDAYCDAGASLESSVDSLAELDLIAEGTDGLESALGELETDVAALQDTAGDAAADDLAALAQSLDQLETALSDLGGEISADNATAVQSAVQGVGTAAQDVYGTLSDC